MADIKKKQQAAARARQAARQRQILMGLAAAGLVVIAGVVAFVVISSLPAAPTTQAAAQASASGTCAAVQTPPDDGRLHLKPGETPTYHSQPPASGTHNDIPEPAGIYDSPVDVTKEVHSLEHGYIVIHYKDASADIVQQLQQIVQSDPRKLILSPYPDMSSPISLTAWDKLQTCTGVDRQAILGFIGNYRDKGPEDVP